MSSHIQVGGGFSPVERWWESPLGWVTEKEVSGVLSPRSKEVGPSQGVGGAKGGRSQVAPSAGCYGTPRRPLTVGKGSQVALQPRCVARLPQVGLSRAERAESAWRPCQGQQRLGGELAGTTARRE